jgi:hypothetical protein
LMAFLDHQDGCPLLASLTISVGDFPFSIQHKLNWDDRDERGMGTSSSEGGAPAITETLHPTTALGTPPQAAAASPLVGSAPPTAVKIPAPQLSSPLAVAIPAVIPPVTTGKQLPPGSSKRPMASTTTSEAQPAASGGLLKRHKYADKLCPFCSETRTLYRYNDVQQSNCGRRQRKPPVVVNGKMQKLGALTGISLNNEDCEYFQKWNQLNPDEQKQVVAIATYTKRQSTLDNLLAEAGRRAVAQTAAQHTLEQVTTDLRLAETARLTRVQTTAKDQIAKHTALAARWAVMHIATVFINTIADYSTTKIRNRQDRLAQDLIEVIREKCFGWSPGGATSTWNDKEHTRTLWKMNHVLSRGKITQSKYSANEPFQMFRCIGNACRHSVRGSYTDHLDVLMDKVPVLYIGIMRCLEYFANHEGWADEIGLKMCRVHLDIMTTHCPHIALIWAERGQLNRKDEAGLAIPLCLFPKSAHVE